MLIRKVRLKNIKSFGEGPAGEGVLVEFDRGINRIGGKNGVGKSSIIEAIGYALFDAEPERGDNRFRVETYLVRTGQKVGEIDVWVETSDGVYRVERDIGQSKRRWKVVREDDGFNEAEGDREVRSFLATLWGLPGPDRLAELFHGLIGVKQGRFTQPFDCAPTYARSHFDPLLDVDIFRRCFDYLLDPLRMLNEQMHEGEKSLRGLEGEMTGLADASSRLAEAEEASVQARHEWETAIEKLNACKKQLARHEEAYQAQIHAAQETALARQILQSAVESLERVEKERTEAEAAAEIAGRSEQGHQVYRSAEEAYQKREEERLRRDRLLKEITERTIERNELNAEKMNQEKAWKEYSEFAEAKRGETEERQKELADRLAGYKQLQQSAEQNTDRAQRVRTAVERIARWHHSLREIQMQMERELRQTETVQEELGAHDGDGLVRAETASNEARNEAESARVGLARAEQALDHLRGQLASIRGGVCPFLAEPCRQFDETAVRDQLDEMERERDEWKGKLVLAEAKTREGEEHLARERQIEKTMAAKMQLLAKSLENLAALWGRSDDPEAARYVVTLGERWPGGEALPALPKPGATANEGWRERFGLLAEFTDKLGFNLGIWRERTETLQEEAKGLSEQAAKENALIGQIENELRRLVEEAGKFSGMAEDSSRRMAAAEAALEKSGQTLVALNGEIEAYRDLDQVMEALRRQMEANRPHYTDYIQAHPLAAKLTEILFRLEQAMIAKEQAEKRLGDAETALAVRTAEYNEAIHNEAKDALQRQLQMNGQIENHLKQAELEIAAQRDRCRQYEELLTKRKDILRDLDGVQSQNVVLDKARTVLKNAQTLVAQNLTRRIQGRAQTIFNAMNREPVQFEWDASEYKLTLHTAAGPRRFTQLSGGQQMKAAIAMQLALVKEFSSAGFCAFDEPTYGLDSESRAMLAEAIVQAQNECRFEQLFVVSHDEAFDDKVEHVVQLGYSSKLGALPVRD